MSENEPSLRSYHGTFAHGVDEKRRVQVPAKWRSQEKESEFTVIVWPTKHGECLRVLSPMRMARLVAEIDAMPSDNPNKTFLKRVIGSRSEQMTLDKVGRICLPEQMAKSAALDSEAIMIGCLTHFEIWNPARHAQMDAANALMVPEAFRYME